MTKVRFPELLTAFLSPFFSRSAEVGICETAIHFYPETQLRMHEVIFKKTHFLFQCVIKEGSVVVKALHYKPEGG
jgi:hypothetical protein